MTTNNPSITPPAVPSDRANIPEDGLAPHVNGKYLPRFIGKRVTLTCEVLDKLVDGSTVIVKATDDAELTLRVPSGTQIDGKYITFRAWVDSATEVTLIGMHLNTDDECDMKLYDNVIRLTFDPRFAHMFGMEPEPAK